VIPGLRTGPGARAAVSPRFHHPAAGLARAREGTGEALPCIALFAPGARLAGGQNAQAVALAAGLAAEGCDVACHPIDPDFPRGLGWVRRIPIARTLLNEALYLTRLAGAIRRAQVVHVFSAAHASYALAALPAIAAARLMGRRSILNYHSGEAEAHFRRWGSIVPWSMRCADAIVVPSEYLRDAFARIGLQTRVIPNTIALDRFRYRARDPLRPRLVVTRSLEPIYGVDAVLEAFAIVQRTFPRARLVIAGEGSQGRRLAALALSLGASGVTFAGRVPEPAMGDLLDGADIFVNASRVDNQPVSILQAFAAGTPVVSTGPGDIPAMLGAHAGTGPVLGERGVLVTEDPRVLADGVFALLEDPVGARAMAARARAAAEQSTWNDVREDWLSIYQEGPGRS